MPRKIVDLSARSNIIRQEPFGLHFWECSPKEYLDYGKWERFGGPDGCWIPSLSFISLAIAD